MDITLEFDTVENKDIFCKKWNLTPSTDTTKLDAEWYLLHDAAQNINVVAITQSQPGEHEFVVSGDKSVLQYICTMGDDLGNGFYQVTTSDIAALAKVTDTIEHTVGSMKFLEVSSITNMPATTVAIDPTSADAQWARIRVASQYRPLSKEFDTHEINYASKPELYVIDTGINFDHPEFDYADLEKVNFYAVDKFNGNFADELGHGTSVASMAVGKNLGVCSYAKLMNVKLSGMISGARYDATLLEIGQAIDAIMNEVAKDPTITRVANISWGVARSTWLDSKILSLLEAGVLVVCAAGNGGVNVDSITPAGITQVMTVGAIDKFDIPAGFNDIAPSDSGLTTSEGLSLDIFAPGDNIITAESNTNSYRLDSGTSFSSPLVAGVALVIASCNSTITLAPTLKKMIMDTATEYALLFQDDRFSDNQNRLIYLFAADPLSNYKQNNAVSYLGVHQEEDTIVCDLNSVLDVNKIKILYPDNPIVYSYEIASDSTDYSKFFTIDSISGLIKIDKPDLPMLETEKLKMVTFKGTAKNSVLTLTSNDIFFFVSNPLYKDSLQSDISLALTNVNSISYFGSWAYLK
jgi:hypothetical protein